jgi:hypothetical protein
VTILPARPARRRADAFAALLEGGAGGFDPALAPLGALVSRLEALPLGPTPEFRDALRGRLLAVAAVAPATTSPSRSAVSDYLASWRGQLRLRLAAGVTAAIVAVTGIGVAASRSLPGDPFYGIKQASEALQLALTHGSLAKGKLELEFARTRLHEVSELVGRSLALPAAVDGQPSAGPPVALGSDTAGHVTEALTAMNSEVRAGSRDLTGYFSATGDRAALSTLEGFAVSQQRQLRALLPALPVGAQPAADSSLQLLNQVETRASTLMEPSACSQDCVPVAGPEITARPSPAATDSLGTLPCPCLTPAAQPSATPASPSPTTHASASPSASPSASGGPSPAPSPSAPSPSPSPSSSFPVPLPTGLLPTPLPTISIPPIPTPSLPISLP